MRFSFVQVLLNVLWKSLKAAANSAAGCSLLCGGLCGFYLVTTCQQLTAQLGTSLVIVTGLCIGIATGLELTSRNRRKPAENTPDEYQARLQFGWVHFGMACWTVMVPWTIGKVILLAEKFGPAPLSSPRMGLFIFGLIAAVLSCITLFGIAQLVTSAIRYLTIPTKPATATHVPSPSDGTILGWSLLGVACGILLDVFFAAPFFGIHAAGLIAALIGGAIFLRCIFLAPRFALLSENEPAGEDRVPIPSESLPPVQEALSIPWTVSVWSCLVAGCFGAVTAVVIRMIHQLFPVSSFLVYVEWAAIIGGTALGLLWIDRRMKRAENHGTKKTSASGRQTPDNKIKAPQQPAFIPIGTLIFTAAWSVCFLAAFSLFIDLTLQLNASVSQVWLQMSIRSLLVTAILLPLGVGFGSIMALSRKYSTAENFHPKNNRILSGMAGLPRLRFATFAAGFLLVRWMLFGLWGPATVLVGLAWLMLFLGVVRWIRRRSLPRHWAAKLTTLSAVCFIAAAPLFRNHYNPARSAKLLFATNVFVARHNGIDPDYLMHLDEGRLITSLEGEQGTHTVWKYRGVQFQFRENGIPRGIISSNLQACPQYASEAMQVIMPLILHDSPRQILILGIGSGVPLTTSLRFPVQKLTIAESDPKLIELLKEVVWHKAEEKPLEDDRVQLLRWDPALAVLLDSRQYDVILSNPNQPMLMQSTPYFTVDFYRRAANRLAKDGIFCQRFQQMDFGAQPLQEVTKTLQDVFTHVIALQAGGGDLLLLGTNSPKGIIRDGLLDRLQADHVRRAFANLGWDWTVPLTLDVYHHQALAEFSEEGKALVNSAANSRFAFQLPQEVMRWGNKRQELHQLLAKHKKQILEENDLQETYPDIARRLEDVAFQREYMTGYPDQYWAYRKPLQRRLLLQPRTEIQLVKGENPHREMHPVDKRRMKYFLELGKALQHPQADDIRRVVRFAEPYDPMISYFLHQEVAELYSRTADGDPKEEFFHRLHAIHYALPQDRSVRNVAEALNLLIDHPEIADDLDRWDHINALCQILKTRWEIRGAVVPKSSRIVLNDIEKSLTALGKALNEIDSPEWELPISEEHRRLRKKYLDISFLRPLRSYRNKLHRHYLQQKKTTERLLKRAVEGDPSPE